MALTSKKKRELIVIHMAYNRWKFDCNFPIAQLRLLVDRYIVKQKAEFYVTLKPAHSLFYLYLAMVEMAWKMTDQKIKNKEK